MIEEMKKAAVDKILQAIKAQRWFFFENNDKILFDSNTAFIWTNLNFFPYCIVTIYDAANARAESPYAISEVNPLIEKINHELFGGFSDWRLPTPDELWNIIEDRTFPFYGDFNWRIKTEWCWYVQCNGKLATKDLDYNGEMAGISETRDNCGRVILCNVLLASVVGVRPRRTPQESLHVFRMYQWIPIFNDEKITELYKIIFVDKQLYKLVFFDELLLAGYDTAAIGKSAIKYFDAVLSVTDELLNVLQEYEAAQADTIEAFLKIALSLSAKYVDNPNLTPEENSLLAERQRFLAKRLELGIDAPKQKILSVKAQAERFFERLNAINEADDSIRHLAALQAEPRADFELLVENLARIIVDTQRKVDFFAEHKNFVANVVEAQAAWSNAYKSFKTSLREELAADCNRDRVEEDIFTAWYDDWRAKRFAIEQRFLPLIEFALKGKFSDAFDDVLKTLQDYRDAVDKFYLHERKNIYQEFAFTAGSELQEKFKTESELYKLAERLQRDLQGIIFSRDTEERIFLLRWSEPLLNLPIDEISNFIRDKELDSIAEEVLTQFAALKRKNFAEYLADSKSYSEAVQTREKEFNALVFKMRKSLPKTK